MIMKKLVCVLLICSISLVGCAGQAANPIAVYRPGDENKSCNTLGAELLGIDKQITQKKEQNSKKESRNMLYFITGFIILVPWFFMDLKESEQVEINALQQREGALKIIAADKNCGF